MLQLTSRIRGLLPAHTSTPQPLVPWMAQRSPGMMLQLTSRIRGLLPAHTSTPRHTMAAPPVSSAMPTVPRWRYTDRNAGHAAVCTADRSTGHVCAGAASRTADHALVCAKQQTAMTQVH